MITGVPIVSYIIYRFAALKWATEASFPPHLSILLSALFILNIKYNIYCILYIYRI